MSRLCDDAAFTAWFAAVDYIYANSNPVEKGLRASVVRIWDGFGPEVRDQFGKERWEALIVRYPQLGVDMWIGNWGFVTRVSRTRFDGLLTSLRICADVCVSVGQVVMGGRIRCRTG
jgi:hypothetical protein